MVDAARLTGCVKPGEIWQLNFWIWILQAEENYVRIQYPIQYLIWKGFYFLAFLLIPVTQVHTTS